MLLGGAGRPFVAAPEKGRVAPGSTESDGSAIVCARAFPQYAQNDGGSPVNSSR
jgi:hypothetical protein